MDENEAEKIIKNTIEYANDEIKKNKIKYFKIFLIIFSILIILLLTFLLIFEYEFPVEYNQNLVDISIPDDQGIDVKINLSNYKNTNAILVKIDENNYDLYICVTQTLSTKIFNNNDKSNHLLRVGNSMIVDFKSGKLRQYIPDGNTSDTIKHIYYIDNLSSKISTMNDNKLINYTNKILVWDRK